ncbi:hypothetical protein PTTG_00442 [Puccinia triticina 1-1 BBBD Race 1]|uniref:Uncharacterized protein n=1 Tax=Puccinia triticina (isolate 1-1 / race 1 (BBBD)) TaxID=630390 RepID=A0A180H4B2_PUCT1|nr:hypothetical protein PTTG_00442 [Puccinia triticina 1-1 BBBD Race 1]WAR53159.1 hypothetical protein PtB15_2B590 [Puccinia triticina]
MEWAPSTDGREQRAGRPESGPSGLSPANWGTVDKAEDDPFSAANPTISNTSPLADRPSFSRSDSRSHTPFVGLLLPATRSPVIAPSSVGAPPDEAPVQLLESVLAPHPPSLPDQPSPPEALFEGHQTQTDSRLSRAEGSDEIAIGANTLPEVSNSKCLGSGDTVSPSSDAILPRPRPP